MFEISDDEAPERAKKMPRKQPDPIEISDDEHDEGLDEELDEESHIPATRRRMRKRETSSDGEDRDPPEQDSTPASNTRLAPNTRLASVVVVRKISSSATPNDPIHFNNIGPKRWPCPANVYIPKGHKCSGAFVRAKEARDHCLAFHQYVPHKEKPGKEKQCDFGAAGALTNTCRMPDCAYLFTNINARYVDKHWRPGVSLVNPKRNTPKLVNNAVRFVISRRVASQKDLPNWAGDESMKWMTKNDCDLVGQAVGPIIEARDVRANTCGPLYVPTFSAKDEARLSEDLIPQKDYQKSGH
jgi:hypothetical protein